MEQLKMEDKQLDWALLAGEIDEFTSSTSNQERKHFYNLVFQIEKELERVQHITKVLGTTMNLFEVFCSDESTLTDQVNNQGGKAMRFGLSQGDLQDAEGRKTFSLRCAGIVQSMSG